MLKIIQNSVKVNRTKIQTCTCSTNSTDLIKKPQMPTELTKKTDITSKEISAKLTTKEDMQWRTPWHQKEGQYYSMLRTFYSEDNNANVLKFLQQPINISPSSIKNWWAKRTERKNIMMQQYIPERNQMLGNELAAAHFIVYRGGSVKFFGDDKWIKSNQFNEYKLPNHFEEDMFLQAIDCTDMELYYEGLVNLRDLRNVEWLSLNGCDKLDDWALDRISNIFSETLLYLDLRNISDISHRGIGGLCKMNNLKILYVDDIYASKEFEMTCLMLQEVNPKLDIRVD